MAEVETTKDINLSKKTIKGSFWTLLLQMSDRLLQIIKSIVLASVLAPGDFGVFGVASIAMVALESFSETGFVYALIQRRKADKRHYNTAWTVHVAKDLLLAVILFCSAPLIGSLFSSPASIDLIRVIGVSVVLQGLINIYTAKLEKNFSFGQVFKYRFLGSIADISLSIISVYLLHNVWALVIGLITGNLVRAIMSFVVVKERPRIKFDKSAFLDLWSFGKWALLSSMIVFLAGYGDNIAAQKILGDVALGIYAMAFKISNTPATEIGRVISRVTLPAYSAIQDTVTRIRKGYLQVLFVTTALSFGLGVIIFGTAKSFTQAFFKPEWEAMIIPLQILTISGMLRAAIGTAGPVYYALNKPKWDTYFQLVRFVVMAILLYPLTIKYGLIGTSAAALAGIAISSIGFFTTVIKQTRCRLAEFFKSILPPLAGTAVSLTILFLSRPYIFSLELTKLMTFLIETSILGITYVATTALIDQVVERRLHLIVQVLKDIFINRLSSDK